MLESAGPHMHSLLDTKAKSSRRWEFIWSVVNHATTHIIGHADLQMKNCMLVVAVQRIGSVLSQSWKRMSMY